MSTTPPPEPPPGASGTARLRARAGKAPEIRPEVLHALDQLEASLGDVGQWEQLLAGAPATTPPIDVDEGIEPDEELDEEIELRGWAEVGMPDGGDEPGAPVPLLTRDVPLAERDAATASITATGPILGEFAAAEVAEAEAAAALPPSEESVLFGARPVDATDPAAEEAERRRRTGRALSWVGVLLVVVAAGYFALVRDTTPDTNGDELPALDDTVETTRRSTTSTTLSTASSLVAADTATEVTAPASPSTTMKPAAKATTSTTRAPVTPTPTATAPNSTTSTTQVVNDPILCHPNRPPQPGCVVSTTTTVPPSTTTTTGSTDGGTGGQTDG